MRTENHMMLMMMHQGYDSPSTTIFFSTGELFQNLFSITNHNEVAPTQRSIFLKEKHNKVK